MKIEKEKSEFLNEMIERWETDGLINEDTGQKLRKSYETKNFDWLRLAQYAFWVALACGFIALGALLIDNTILRYLKQLYNTPNIVIAMASAALAAWLYPFGFKRKKNHPHLKFSNDAIILAAILFTANAVAYLGKAIDHGSANFSLLMLLATFIYAAIAFKAQSRLIWSFALIALGLWFWAQTGYISHWNNYFWGMNYPLRFVFFGTCLTLFALLLKNYSKSKYFFQVTYVIALIYLFVSLWALSIFGNFISLEEWYSVRQYQLFYWAILSAAVCVGFTYFGLKNNDALSREFGITFLFINLYSRYFEYFWNNWHKALFFSVLALSFWLIGRKAEKIWNLNFLK